MSDINIMKSTTKDIIIESTGKSVQEAYGNAFKALRKKVYSEVEGLIIQMEPSAVYIVNEEINEYTEKFLFFFMPRQKKDYKLKIKITVNLKYIEK